eukprot:355411-Chlamydomonas_euryale.AAC.1
MAVGWAPPTPGLGGHACMHPGCLWSGGAVSGGGCECVREPRRGRGHAARGDAAPRGDAARGDARACCTLEPRRDHVALRSNFHRKSMAVFYKRWWIQQGHLHEDYHHSTLYP